jgi:hypothetical protein
MLHEHGLFMTKQELRRGVHARFSCESQNALLEMRAESEVNYRIQFRDLKRIKEYVMMGSVNKDQQKLDLTDVCSDGRFLKNREMKL